MIARERTFEHEVRWEERELAPGETATLSEIVRCEFLLERILVESESPKLLIERVETSDEVRVFGPCLAIGSPFELVNAYKVAPGTLLYLRISNNGTEPLKARVSARGVGYER